MKWNRTGTGTDEMESDGPGPERMKWNRTGTGTDEMESDRDRNG